MAAGRLAPATAEDDVPPDDWEALAPTRSIVGPEVPSALLHQGLMAWAALFGTVSFQLHGIIGEQLGDREAYFAESVRRWAAQLGITPAGTAPAARKHRRPLEPACADSRHRRGITAGITSAAVPVPLPARVGMLQIS
jgi:hypothetical protein